jgi:hypothetical protein
LCLLLLLVPIAATYDVHPQQELLHVQQDCCMYWVVVWLLMPRAQMTVDERYNNHTKDSTCANSTVVERMQGSFPTHQPTNSPSFERPTSAMTIHIQTHPCSAEAAACTGLL